MSSLYYCKQELKRGIEICIWLNYTAQLYFPGTGQKANTEKQKEKRIIENTKISVKHLCRNFVSETPGKLARLPKGRSNNAERSRERQRCYRELASLRNFAGSRETESLVNIMQQSFANTVALRYLSRSYAASERDMSALYSLWKGSKHRFHEGYEKGTDRKQVMDL